MSSHHCLRVIRLENLQWRHPLHSNVPYLYMEVTLGDTTRRTSFKKGTSPVWDEPLEFACDPTNQTATFNVRVKHHSIWKSDACVGVVDHIDPDDLIKRCAQGEAALSLTSSRRCSTTSIGRIFLHLQITDAVAAAGTNIAAALKAVSHSGIERSEGAYELTQRIQDRVGWAGDQTDLYKAFGELVSRIDAFRPILNVVSELHPFLTIAWKLASGLFKVVQGVFETDKRVVRLVHKMRDAFDFARDVQQLADKVTGIRQPIAALLKQTIECCVFIREYVGRGFAKRVLDQSEQKVNEFEQALVDSKQLIESGMDVGIAFVSVRSAARMDEMVLKQRLNPTLSQSFDRTPCLDGTRMAIREQILDWIFSDDTRNVFWLHGVAGSGKSTIIMTIVEQLRNMSRLGAFLFFERAKSDPATVIASIAYQLASFDSSIGSVILSETETDRNVITGTPSQQFEKLIRRPLSTTTDSIAGPVLIALDAFDECGTPVSRRSLMKLIQEEFPKLPITFRFLITGRREADIDKFLSSHSENVVAIELDYHSQSSQDDVLTYIRTEMDSAIRDVVEVPSGWPWDDNMALLGRAARGLFIWGSTAVKMVKISDDPFEQLECLISDSRSLAGFGLDQLYSTVLLNSGIAWENNKSRKRFVKVLSLLLLSKVQLTSEAIDGLLGFPPHKTSRLVLSRLRSVLSYTAGGPVNLLHASFADYLMSSERCKDPWSIDASAAKHLIVDRCFIVMKDLLRFNICDVRTSFSRNDDDTGLAGRVDSSIPAHLEYACLYWSKHLTDVDCSADCVKELSDFAYHRLLFWFEVLSLKKQFVRIAVRALVDIVSWIGERDAVLASFLQDASKLANIFTSPIMESVPHIYISMIPLSRNESIVSAHYSKYLHSAVGIERKGVKQPAVCLKVLAGHSGCVHSVSVSPDGRRIASAFWDGTVRVWDLDSGEEILSIEHLHVLSVCFFPDGERFVSGDGYGTVTVWNAENGHVVLGPLNGHTSDVWAVAVSPNRSMFASGSHDKTIIIWGSSDGRIMSHLTGHTKEVTSLSFSPDSTRLASSSWDSTVRIWNVNSGELALAPFEHTDSVLSVAFSPDSRHLVSDSGSKVTIWDSEMGNVISVLEGHTNQVTSVGYSPCGTRIVSGSDDRTIIVWDAVSGEIVSGPLEGHTDVISCVTFSPDGKYIISGSFDNTVRVWDATPSTVTPEKYERHTDGVLSVAFSADGSRIASAAADGSIIIWDALTGDIVAGPLLGHSKPVRCVSFTPDGSRLISGSEDGTIRVRDGSTGELVLAPLEVGDTRCIAVSPDGTKVVSGHKDGIRVWDVATGVLIAGPLHGHSQVISLLVYSHDGRRLASCSIDGAVKIWDTSTWLTDSEPLRGPSDPVFCVSFSPDSTLLASGSYSGTVLVQDVRNEQVIHGPFRGHTGTVTAVVFLLDGLHVVSGSTDRTLRVWNVKSGQTISVLMGHLSDITSLLALSPDCTRLVSGSWDIMVRVWNVSDLGRYGDSDLAPSTPSSSGDVSDWVLGDDGWIRSERNQYNMLLWIPPDLRRTLWSPRNTLILNCEFSTKIDFTDAAIGERWSECFGQLAAD